MRSTDSSDDSLTLRVLDSLSAKTRNALYCNLAEVIAARREGREPVTAPVPFRKPSEDPAFAKPRPREWGEPVPLPAVPRAMLPAASLQSKRAADRARAEKHRAKVRAERIADGWVPPEERTFKHDEEKRAADRERAKRHRDRKKGQA